MVAKDLILGKVYLIEHNRFNPMFCGIYEGVYTRPGNIDDDDGHYHKFKIIMSWVPYISNKWFIADSTLCNYNILSNGTKRVTGRKVI